MPDRVLHLIDTGGPGGAETVFTDLIDHLDSAAWDSVAVVPTVDWLHAELARRGLEPVLASAAGSFDLSFLRTLVSTARRTGARLVQAHLLGSAVYGGTLARLLRIPMVATFHGQADIAGDESYLAAKLRIIDHPRNRVVFVSSALREHFAAMGAFRRASTHVVHNGVDLRRFVPARSGTFRRELGIEPGTTLIGAVGNVRPAKSYDVFLDAAAVLLERRPDLRFVIVGQGDGPLLADLVRRHERLGLGDRVRFAGFREDIVDVLGGIDVYVSSSTREGFSLTTLQAVASGVPVVATRSGGPTEIVEEGRSGLFADPGSAADLAARIEEVLMGALTGGKPPGSAERRRLAPVDGFTTAAMAGAYERIYRSCVEASSAAHPVAARAPAGTGR